MGTDIEMHAESRVDGKWRAICQTGTEEPLSIDVDRNRLLWKILADLGDGQWGDRRIVSQVRSISKPRGLPHDLSDGLVLHWSRLEALPHNKFDHHTPSWLTLSEIETFPWKEVVDIDAEVDRRAARLFPIGRRGFPDSGWPDGIIPGVGSRHPWIATAPVRWHESFEELCTTFTSNVLPMLRTLGSPDSTRVVYWFWSRDRHEKFSGTWQLSMHFRAGVIIFEQKCWRISSPAVRAD